MHLPPISTFKFLAANAYGKAQLLLFGFFFLYTNTRKEITLEKFYKEKMVTRTLTSIRALK
jgi:hypothetical protein